MDQLNEVAWKAEVEFNRALCAAQKDARGGPKLDQSFEADGRNTGKSFSFKYTSAQFMCEWARGILNGHGLTVSRSGRTTTSQDGNLLIINVPFRIRHVAGHSDEFSVAYPVTVPAGGTIVRGCTASHTTLLKTALMDVLTVRGDDEAADEDAHREVAPAGMYVPAPIGLPGMPASLPASTFPPPRPAPAPVSQEAVTQSNGPTPKAIAADAVPIAAAPPKPLAEAATPPPSADGALSKLVATCRRLPKEKLLPALIGVNGALQDAQRQPVISETGSLLRNLEPADFAPITSYTYEIEAHLGGNAGTPAASPSAGAPHAQASTSAAPAPSSAQAGTEATAATDPILKARLDTFFATASAARKKKGEERDKFTEKLNAAAGAVVLDNSPFAPEKFTASIVGKIEDFVSKYAATA